MSNPGRPLKIAVVAGEESGDLLGADLIDALRERAGRPVELIGVGGDHHDLHARDHHVVHAQLGDLEGTFQHGQGVGAEQAVDLGGAQLVDQFRAVAWLAGKQMAQSIPPGAMGRAAGTAGVVVHYSKCNCPWLGGKPSLAENP